MKYVTVKAVGGNISRAPHGARGLKSADLKDTLEVIAGRAPHGARGLKSMQLPA